MECKDKWRNSHLKYIEVMPFSCVYVSLCVYQCTTDFIFQAIFKFFFHFLENFSENLLVETEFKYLL